MYTRLESLSIVEISLMVLGICILDDPIVAKCTSWTQETDLGMPG